MSPLFLSLLLAVTTQPTPAGHYALLNPAGTCQAVPAAVLRNAQAAARRPPHPLVRVHTEGTLPHHGSYDESQQAKTDWPAMFSLALSYRATHDAADLQALSTYLTAWLGTYQVSFDPIDETSLDNVIYALDLTQTDLSPALRGQAQQFLRQLAEGYLRPRTANKATDRNNWQSHRVKIGTLAAFALGDDRLIAAARTAFETQLKTNIEPDGSTIDFHLRDALHYQTYDLEPLLVAALAARQHGQDWFSLDGHALGRALSFLAPYARGEQVHQEFVHSTVAFDAARRQAGMSGFSGPWEPQKAALTYALAAALDPQWQALADSLGKPPIWLQALTLCRAGN